MSGDIIKSFLVSLGFEVDPSSLAKFNKAITSATAKVTAMYAAVNIAAAGIFAGIAKISEGFEEMGYEYRLIAPAINKAIILRNELLKAYSLAGVNIGKVIQQSVRFNMSLAKTGFAFKAIYASVASKFFPLLTKQMDLFRKQIYANMPRIQQALEKFVKFVFKAFEAVTILGARVWSILQRVFDFFVKLDKATDGWSTIVLGVLAAWKLLNLSFLATPLGMLLAGLVALLALYDDFKTFQEGGESLFNWTKALPTIEAAKYALLAVKDVLLSVYGVVKNVISAFISLFHLDFSGFADSMKAAFGSVIDLVKSLFNTFLGMIDIAGSLGSAIAKLLTGKEGDPNKPGLFDKVDGGLRSLFGANPDNASSNIQAPVKNQQANPLGTNVANSNQTNQNVNQQTNINVQGSADANSIGKSIAGEQTRVNFDMVRNLKGATR